MRTHWLTLLIIVLLLIGALPVAAHAPEGGNARSCLPLAHVHGEWPSPIERRSRRVLPPVIPIHRRSTSHAQHQSWRRAANPRSGAGDGYSPPPSSSEFFIGLVDQDDTTAEIRPELATHRNMSPDGKTYTFTLRGDAVWSDGTPITAQDVRYGILRTLGNCIGRLRQAFGAQGIHCSYRPPGTHQFCAGRLSTACPYLHLARCLRPRGRRGRGRGHPL